MKIFKDKHILQKEISKTKGISFVPTMGGLHKGHISLIKQSKKSKFKTLVSIFVNPKQFNKKSDYRSYPRSTKKDLKKLKNFKKVYPKLNIGDCLVHDSIVIHGSNKNLSNISRRGLTLRYLTKNSKRDIKKVKIYEKQLSKNLRNLKIN